LFFSDRSFVAQAAAGAVIPYLPPPPPVSLLGLHASVFGLLLLAGMGATFAALVLRGRAVRLATARELERFAAIVLVAALAGAQVAGTIARHGALAIIHPGLLLSTAADLPSAPAAAAGALAGWLFVRRRGEGPRPWADVVAYAVPFGWLFARAGCALAHDHLGALSDSWLAVRFPGGARLDCGLLEALATPLLIALAVALGRRAMRPGALAAAVGAAYAALRFGLDFLRAADVPGADARWLGLTLAQWTCLSLLGASAWLGRAPTKSRESAPSPEQK
jgi:phosphatidylglycerol:prolipoprotein diacylglycerol transferase